jgi:hypothetical protein
MRGGLVTKTLPTYTVLTLSSSQHECLKWLALVTMTLDHANKTLWTFQPVFFGVGRLAFPLFVFLIAYNLERRGVSWRKYIFPFIAVGLLSQPIKMFVMDAPWWYFNIMATLLLGVLYTPVTSWLRSKNGFLGPVVAVTLFFLLSLPAEYGPAGVFLIPVTRWFLRQPSFTSGLGVIGLVLAANSFSPTSLVPLLLPPIILFVSRLELSLPRIKQLGYWFYPLHLAALGCLATVF